jgi:hypothetical protein
MKFTEEKLEKAFVESPEIDNTKYIQKLSSFLNNKLDETIIFVATIKQ